MVNNGNDLCDRTFRFSVRIVRFCKVLDDKRGVCRPLANQLLRSGTSIGANVEEAQGGQSKRDFVAKISIAHKEARETLYWLRLLLESELLSTNALESIIDESNQLVSILTSILKSAKK